MIGPGRNQCLKLDDLIAPVLCTTSKAGLKEVLCDSLFKKLHIERNIRMTRFIAAYDTEHAVDCLSACGPIKDVHAEFDFPATFFIVGKRLKRKGENIETCLVMSLHLKSLRIRTRIKCCATTPFCGPAPDNASRLQELQLGKELVEQTFGRPCVGLRPGCGFAEGLRGDEWLLSQVETTGFKYVSSVLWGPETTLPALLVSPSTYAEDGFPSLWELPGHGWHENLLKSHNLTDTVQRILAWPPQFPEAIPQGPVKTPEEEFAIHRILSLEQ